MDKNEVVKSMIDVRYEPFVNKQEIKDYKVINASDIIGLGGWLSDVNANDGFVKTK